MATQACVAARHAARAAVVTTACPRGGAISEGTKNAAEAPHTATASPLARKINGCHRSAAADAFFPRRLGARSLWLAQLVRDRNSNTASGIACIQLLM